MEMLRKLLFLLVIFTSSCSIVDQFEDTYNQRFSANDVVNINQLQSKALRRCRSLSTAYCRCIPLVLYRSDRPAQKQ